LYLLGSEIIEYFNNQHSLEVINANVLYNPIKSINIKRDSNLKIILETTSGLNSKTQADIIPAGMVYTNTNEVDLKINFQREHLFYLV